MYARASKFKIIDRRAELDAARKARPNGAVAQLRRTLGIDVLFLEELISLRHHLVNCNDVWMHYLAVDPFAKHELDAHRDHTFLAAYAEQTSRWVHTIQHGSLDEGFFDELALLSAFFRENNLPMSILQNGVRAACEHTLARTKYSKSESPEHLRKLCERCLLKILTLSTHVISRSYTLWQDAFTTQKTFSLNPDEIGIAEIAPTHTDTSTRTVSYQSLPSHLQRKPPTRAKPAGQAPNRKGGRDSDVRPWSFRKK